MPVTNVKSKWVSGNLIFTDNSDNQLAAIKTSGVEIGSDPVIAGFTFTPAAGTTNVCDVVITAVDAAGTAVAVPVSFDLWLSDAATGVGHTGTSASGTVTAKSASGLVVATLVSKKALRVQALATGLFTLEITDSAKTAFYVCAQTPTGVVSVSTVLATGNYG